MGKGKYRIEKDSVQETLMIPLIGIKDVKAFFSLEDASEILSWGCNFKDVTSRSYMRGYRDIYNDVSRFHKIMIRFCDKLVKMVIIKITFK